MDVKMTCTTWNGGTASACPGGFIGSGLDESRAKWISEDQRCARSTFLKRCKTCVCRRRSGHHLCGWSLVRCKWMTCPRTSLHCGFYLIISLTVTCPSCPRDVVRYVWPRIQKENCRWRMGFKPRVRIRCCQRKHQTEKKQEIWGIMPNF